MTSYRTPFTASLAGAKWAFSTRRVQQSDIVGINDRIEEARSGDLVLGRVEQIGSHKRLQLTSGRGSELYPDDLVVVACGDRYAPDQFEGIARLNRQSSDLLASGGVLGQMRQKNGRIGQPTSVVPIGLLTDANGQIVNLSSYAEASARPSRRPTTIGLVGASMNSGKTTAAAALANGLRRAGHRVGVIKITGTAAFGDYNAYIDSGAHFVCDFVDAGMVSTYRQPVKQIETALELLLGLAGQAHCDVVIVEFADGILQSETAALLRSDYVRSEVPSFLFAVPDALSAVGGSTTLSEIGIEPLAITGVVSQSPLASAEAEAMTGLPIWTRDALCDPAKANALLASAASAAPLCEAAA
ncbi:DUF1611 domain-containing protein [Algihabitans albus]|uniref:DUF1611 domain-containing protein n=1 Tax=Algihabitans albus TaxID=2164067 RepID=UPI000E5C9AAA|nr:DUF1611 domain-containing protein [Algihabitans albus]